jgi:hypothetical protein
LASSIPAWHLSRNEWQTGKIIQFAPLGSVPRFVIASDDGTFAWVDMDHVRHGDKPAMLPRLATDFAGGKRPHTLKLHQGKWLLARPDGRMIKEFDNNEQGKREADAHYDRLEPELAKIRLAQAEPARVVPTQPLATVKPV